MNPASLDAYLFYRYDRPETEPPARVRRRRHLTSPEVVLRRIKRLARRVVDHLPS